MFDKHIVLVHLRTLGTYFWLFLACLHIARPHSFSLTTNSTTTMSSTRLPIDQEWAQSLIGIRLQVPQSWWLGYNGSEMYSGAVQELDFSDERGRYFMMMMLGVVIQCDTMPSSATPTRSNVGILASASRLTRLTIRRMNQSVCCIAMLPNIPSTHRI